MLGENHLGLSKLIEVVKERLKKPWLVRSIDANLVTETLGENEVKVREALFLCDQIGSILAFGAKGNPRQIKRFLNTLLLRHRFAIARGFGDEVKITVLAKLLLAERFLPHFFDKLAMNAARSENGKCDDLLQIEKEVVNKESTYIEVGSSRSETQLKNRKSKNKSNSIIDNHSIQTLADEWKSSPEILKWAAIQPSLFDIDLRPYLFLAKDRKDYFGPTQVFGGLAVLIEELFGPKIKVQTLETQLQRLGAGDAADVFEGLRARIISGDEFKQQPEGIDGLSILVKVQPQLQSKLLDFLESLPIEKLGAWVVQGWNMVIVDNSQKSRFSDLLKTWAEKASDQILKSAAGGVLKARKVSK